MHRLRTCTRIIKCAQYKTTSLGFGIAESHGGVMETVPECEYQVEVMEEEEQLSVPDYVICSCTVLYYHNMHNIIRSC